MCYNIYAIKKARLRFKATHTLNCERKREQSMKNSNSNNNMMYKRVERLNVNSLDESELINELNIALDACNLHDLDAFDYSVLIARIADLMNCTAQLHRIDSEIDISERVAQTYERESLLLYFVADVLRRLHREEDM